MPLSTANFTTTATHVIQSDHSISLPDPYMLGPFDHLYHFATPVNAVWIYQSSPSVNLIPVERLRKAIRRFLDYYPHLTGRLRIDPATGVRSMTRLGTGIHFFEAHCDAPLRSFARSPSAPDTELSVFDFPNAGNALLAPWDPTLEGAQRDPILTIQRTEFACSSVALGVRISHVLCGAGSFLGLYQDLAAIYRAMADPATAAGNKIGLTSPPHHPPFMVSEMLHMGDHERRQALADPPAAYNPIVGRSLRFSAAAVLSLKAQAVNPDTPCARVSAFTALAAHIWQRVQRARLLADTNTEGKTMGSSVFGTSVNFLPHLSLPDRTFGNTVVTPVIELESTALTQAPLWQIAGLINDRVRHVSPAEVRQLGRWIAAQPDTSRIQLNFPVMAAAPFIATGWHRFPLYAGAEMDGVAPSLASPVFMDALFDGMVYFVEPKVRDGGVEAVASLRRSIWACLERDEGFGGAWDGV
ncbi:uncharacterized protein BO66DRAFT_470553 [Aspergillus aculeatinus CBS 121060]|uniref:Uncharacterized protein n=1 Tax=Aspergillus aculeatinus CBS 121060 TaxID=1448322 RepID=A0ACD1HD38_9EURO|nr:hypothetical protein BO66DRAFT_470553 [Aspergillus aculeatinus CBS 121060]RAH71402.1 hypothetical protein BO66DRAFT_470553 [Aspergillus aculeatinus CBS 121060]